MLDKEDYRNLFLEYYPVLKRRAFYILQSNEAAEDIVQDVFYKLWEKRTQEIENHKAYLTRAVINSCLNHLDKHKRITHSDDDTFPERSQNTTEQTLSFNELNQQLESALEDLSPQRKIIFSLSLYESMSNQEIADQMGITKKTVDNQLGTALKQLREKLANFIDLLMSPLITAAVILIFS